MGLAAQCRWTVLRGVRHIEVIRTTRSGSWGCTSEGWECGLVLHEVTTGRAAHAPRACGSGWRLGRRTRVRVCCGCWNVGGLRGELGAQRGELLTMGRTEEAIIAHLDKALG